MLRAQLEERALAVHRHTATLLGQVYDHDHSLVHRQREKVVAIRVVAEVVSLLVCVEAVIHIFGEEVNVQLLSQTALVI